jgi:hypothetical protein
MKNRIGMIAREDDELSVLPGRGLGMINMHRTEKRWLLLFRFIHVGIRMLCARDKMHRRGVAH